MIKEVFLGIDLGTSSVKVAVVDPDGGVSAQGSAVYATSCPRLGWAEQDPREWWHATCQAASVALQEARNNSPVHVAGIGVTGQMHSFVLVDGAGEPLRPAITWLDNRARDLVNDTTDMLKRAGLHSGVANEVSAGLTLCPLRWLLLHEADHVHRAAALLSAKDYIRFRLTGAVAADPTDGSATLLMDVRHRRWFAREMEELLGIPGRILPPLQEPWSVAGVLREEHRAVFGGNGTKQTAPPVVATGCGDQQAAALANALVHSGTIQMMLGTGGQIATPVEEMPGETRRSLNYFCHCRNWLVQGSLQNGGSAVEWARGILGASWEELEGVLARHNPEGAPLFLPYLTGERTPIMDSSATAAWVQVRHGTTRDDLLYAAVEGVVFGLVDALQELHREDDVVLAGGGGARSPGFMQLLSDASRRELHVMPQENTTALGAAILGSVAAGRYAHLEDAVAALGLTPVATVTPREERSSRVAHRRRRFQKLRDQRGMIDD